MKVIFAVPAIYEKMLKLIEREAKMDAGIARRFKVLSPEEKRRILENAKPIKRQS